MASAGLVLSPFFCYVVFNAQTVPAVEWTRDSQNGQLVSGKVLVNNVAVGNTNVRFSYKFRGQFVTLPSGETNEVAPVVTVNVTGYPVTGVSITFLSLL